MAHTPSTRIQPASYTREDDGWRVTYHDDPNVWEVICPDCGDDGGPIENQSAEVRTLRGPYPTKDEAWRVVVKHSGGEP
jgi:hypothetical protein